MKALRVPFRIEGGGVLSVYDPASIIKQKIINCLVVNKRERTGLPFYGAGASGLLFDDVEDQLTQRDFSTDALQELRASVSDASILDIQVVDTDVGEVTLSVTYRTQLSTVQTVVFTISELDVLTEESPL